MDDAPASSPPLPPAPSAPRPPMPPPPPPAPGALPSAPRPPSLPPPPPPPSSPSLRPPASPSVAPPAPPAVAPATPAVPPAALAALPPAAPSDPTAEVLGGPPPAVSEAPGPTPAVNEAAAAAVSEAPESTHAQTAAPSAPASAPAAAAEALSAPVSSASDPSPRSSSADAPASPSAGPAHASRFVSGAAGNGASPTASPAASSPAAGSEASPAASRASPPPSITPEKAWPGSPHVSPASRSSLLPAGCQRVRLLTACWNMGNAAPFDFAPWVPLGGEGFDLIACGLMEATFAAPGEASQMDESDEDDDAAAPSSQDMKKLNSMVDGVHSKKEKRLALAGSRKAAGGGGSGGGPEESTSFSNPMLGAGGRKAAAGASAPSASAPAAPAVGVPALGATKRSINKNHKSSSLALYMSADAPIFDMLGLHIGDGFEVVASHMMLQIGLILFCRKGALTVTEVVIRSEGTGLLGFAPNKGGCVVSVLLNGVTRVVFVASHLAAHMKHAEVRDLNAAQIVNKVRLEPLPQVDFDTAFDHCFWMGDLNYRVDLAISKGAGAKRNVENQEHFEEVQERIAAGDFGPLLAADQLQHAMRTGSAFQGFREAAAIAFPPTFKVRRVAGHSYNPQRVSSWADRVLIKSRPALIGDAKTLRYTSHPEVCSSDHKPVSAAIELLTRTPRPCPLFPLRASLDSLPGPILRLTCLKGSRMLAVDLTGLSDPYIVFFTDLGGCRVDGSTLRGQTTPPRTSTVKQSLNPVWPDVVDLKLAASSPADLEFVHLFLTVFDEDDISQDDPMGQAALPLGSAAFADKGVKEPFDLVVCKGTRAHGRIEGYVEILWPSHAGDILVTQHNDALETSCCTIA